MKKEDLTQYSDQELSLRVFNDEGLYKERRRSGFFDLLEEVFEYTEEQEEVLKQDLQDEEAEEEREDQEYMLNLVLEDLEGWIHSGGGESNDSMVYAFNNGFKLHAASVWLGSGASSEDLDDKIKGLVIDRDEEMKEIRLLCEEAYIYICPECNHHGFEERDEGDSITCFSCHAEAFKEGSEVDRSPDQRDEETEALNLNPKLHE